MPGTRARTRQILETAGPACLTGVSVRPVWSTPCVVEAADHVEHEVVDPPVAGDDAAGAGPEQVTADGGDPTAAWRKAKEQHPEPGQLVSAANEQLSELLAFLQRQAIVSVPESEPVVVAPSPEFYRWAFASMWTPGPFESKPSQAYYYLTDVDRSWSPERQKEHMRDFNVPTLWNISIHEVYPGHFLHYQHLRRVDSKVRKSLMFASASFVEGWAHYSEHMMVEAGFRKGRLVFLVMSATKTGKARFGRIGRVPAPVKQPLTAYQKRGLASAAARGKG